MSDVEQWEHDEQRAMENEIISLREQVEKLTKERDAEIARNRPLQSLIKLTEETKSFLLKKSEENKEAVKQLDSERQANALLTEELAALAEQNEKMRKVLLRLACLGNGDQYGNSIGNCIAQEALSLPNLATPPVSEDQKDAERYLWLRASDFDIFGSPHAIHLSGKELDQAIDAAMQEDKP